MIKRAYVDKYNIILQLSPKRVEIFILLEVLAWVMTACWILHSSLIYFWRNMHISSIFYFSKSTSINTQYSSLWDTLKMMLFSIKILNKMKMLWQNQLKISVSVLFKTLYWSRNRCYTWSPKDIWDLPCLLHLLFWFHVSNYRNFWNNERWKSCIKYFSIMKLFHLQKPLSKWR